MENTLKEVAKFSPDAIRQGAIRANTPMDQIDSKLKELLSILKSGKSVKKPKVKRLGTSKSLSDKDLFQQHILPSLIAKMKEVENMKESFDWNVDFGYTRHVSTITNADEFKRLYEMVCANEKSSTRNTLVIQFQRGELLVLARQNGLDLKVPYTTERRYMTLYTIIKKYPMLLVCDLTFSQLVKHKNRLLEALNQVENNDLSCALSQDIQFVAQGTRFCIKPTEAEIEIPEEPQNFDPDASFQELSDSRPEDPDEFDQFIGVFNPDEKMEAAV